MTGEPVIKAPLGVNNIPNRARSRSLVARPPWLAGQLEENGVDRLRSGTLAA